MGMPPRHTVSENQELMREWDYSKNEILGCFPDQLGVSSHKKVCWKCINGHEYSMIIRDKSRGTGNCPICSGHRIASGYNDLKTKYPSIAKHWHPTLNGKLKPEQVASRSNRKYYWLCENGHTYIATPDKQTLGRGCPYCGNRQVLTGYNDLQTLYPSIAAEWDKEKNDGSPRDCIFKSRKKIHWICSDCGEKWQATPKDRIKSKTGGCPNCAKQIRGERKHKTALRENGCITNSLLLKEWDYERNIKGPKEYTKSSNKKVHWICSKCGYHYMAQINNRENGRGCPCCVGKTVVEGINDLATTHPLLAAEWHPILNGELKPNQVTAGRAQKIWWICHKGHEYQATINHRSTGTNCPTCNSGRQTSFAEQAVFYYVKKLYPDTVNRYKAPFLKRMELDIYIPSIRFAIEYDGEAWHKEDKRKRESIKYWRCKEQGIKVIRLKEAKLEHEELQTCDEAFHCEKMYEEKNLERMIFWLLCKLDFSHYRTIVDVCLERDRAAILDMYKQDEKGKSLAVNYPEIAKEWHPTLNRNVTPENIMPYSDIKVWWKCPICGNSYTATPSHRVTGTGCPKCGIRKSAIARAKKVEMISAETGETLQVFESISEAGRQLRINPANIGMVCRGQRNIAGGYGWRYS